MAVEGEESPNMKQLLKDNLPPLPNKRYYYKVSRRSSAHNREYHMTVRYLKWWGYLIPGYDVLGGLTFTKSELANYERDKNSHYGMQGQVRNLHSKAMTHSERTGRDRTGIAGVYRPVKPSPDPEFEE